VAHTLELAGGDSVVEHLVDVLERTAVCFLSCGTPYVSDFQLRGRIVCM
jgi:hypothetical protein